MASKWSLADLTEFDLRMHKGVSAEAPLTSDTADQNKTSVLLAWTQQQRAKDPEPQRLVHLAIHSETWLGISLWVFSFLAGITAAATLLRYEGLRLINISAYLGVLVGGQLLMLLGLLLGSLFFRKRILELQHSLMPKFIKQLPSPQSLPAWRWRIFGSFQRAGIGFNLGILLLSFWKVATYDLAFGWATTLSAGADSIHRITQGLALPWGGKFAPTLLQIEESRIVLKSGLSQIDSSSTAAWWPFLFMCVLFYGLLPRLLLAGFAAFKLNWILRHPPLHAPESERLYLALTRKPLQYESDPQSDSASKSEITNLQPLQPAAPLQLQMPAESMAETALPAFKRVLEETFSLELNDQGEGRLIVVEAWQPPLEETLRQLRDLRIELGREPDLLVLAVGFPDKDHYFQTPEARDIDSWQRRLSELKDPKLGLLIWRLPA
jgi:hypothetical protein